MHGVTNRSFADDLRPVARPSCAAPGASALPVAADAGLGRFRGVRGRVDQRERLPDRAGDDGGAVLPRPAARAARHHRRAARGAAAAHAAGRHRRLPAGRGRAGRRLALRRARGILGVRRRRRRDFLRGTQATGADGVARFDTIWPGWYRGRTTHIHYKVLLADRSALTSQIFFPDEVSAAVHGSAEPYAAPRAAGHLERRRRHRPARRRRRLRRGQAARRRARRPPGRRDRSAA